MYEWLQVDIHNIGMYHAEELEREERERERERERA